MPLPLMDLARRVADASGVECKAVDDSGSLCAILMSPPVFLREHRAYDGLLEYEFEVWLGKIEDDAAFPAADLLCENGTRQAFYAVRRGSIDSMLILRDKITVVDSVDDDSLVEIVVGSIVTDFHFGTTEIPGVKFYRR